MDARNLPAGNALADYLGRPGITKTSTASCLGVSRATLNDWVHNGIPVDKVSEAEKQLRITLSRPAAPGEKVVDDLLPLIKAVANSDIDRLSQYEWRALRSMAKVLPEMDGELVRAIVRHHRRTERSPD